MLIMKNLNLISVQSWTYLKATRLSVRPNIPEVPGRRANGTDIFRNFIPKLWVYLARLA